MGSDWALPAKADAPHRRPRAPVAGESCGAQRHLVDPPDRRPMGRSPGPVSLLSNAPPAVSAVGARGCLARRSRGPRPGSPRRRLSGSAGNLQTATPHEVTLVHATLAQRFVKLFPVRLIGDNAYESDCLDADLARRGVELIAPHRRTRTSRTRDGRPLRRYRRRWKTRTSGGSLSATSDPPRFSCDATPRLLPDSLARFMRWLLRRLLISTQRR